MGSITKLEAVNHILLMAGESLVSDLESDSGIDTATASFVLDRYIDDHQIRGLMNNKYQKKYTLTAEGNIVLPSDTISAELISFHSNDDGYTIYGTMRTSGSNRVLYNITDQKTNWDASIDYWIEIIHELLWEDIDTPVQRGILASAARQYQLVMQGDGATDQYLGGLETLYLAKSRAADIDDAKRSVFMAGTPKLKDAILRRDPTNDPDRFRYWHHRGA